MRKLILLMLMAVIWPISSQAKRVLPYLDEIYALGSVAGQGLACRSDKYDQFELLARAILVGKAQNGAQQREGMREYNIGRVEGFTAVADEGFMNCDVILPEFERQKIFKSILYSDGRMQLYDGTMIKPRKTYNAAKLYQKDPQAFDKANEAYKKYLAIMKEKGQNGKKIPLYDSNYGKYENQMK